MNGETHVVEANSSVFIPAGPALRKEPDNRKVDKCGTVFLSAIGNVSILKGSNAVDNMHVLPSHMLKCQCR